jgi:hypothetical protein
MGLHNTYLFQKVYYTLENISKYAENKLIKSRF